MDKVVNLKIVFKNNNSKKLITPVEAYQYIKNCLTEREIHEERERKRQWRQGEGGGERTGEYR